MSDALYHKRYLRDRLRLGPSYANSQPFVAMLRYAKAAGISLAAIGVDRHYLQPGWTPQRIQRRTRERILTQVERLLDERQEAIDDCRSCLAFVRHGNTTPEPTFPVEPLRAALEGRTALLEDADRRYLYRGRPWTVERVQRACDAAGMDPASVYGDSWYELEEAG